MRRIFANEFVSLDGVIQGPGDPDEDREGGFDRGGWTGDHWDPVLDEQFMALTEPDENALLLGRKTYEIFAAFWPSLGPDNPAAARMDALEKYVVSTTLTRVDWVGATLVKGDFETSIRELKEMPGSYLWVPGSGGLVQSLAAHGLLDGFRLMIFPVIVGSGKKLLPGGAVPFGLRLVDSIVTDSGVIVATYERADGAGA